MSCLMLHRTIHVASFLLVLISACSRPNLPTETPSPTSPPASTHPFQISPTLTMTAEIKSIPTTLVTAKPPTAIPTVIPTVILTEALSTALPRPTLSGIEARSMLVGLLQDNGGCQLPCLWGFSPGATDAHTLSAWQQQWGNISVPKDIEVFTNDLGPQFVLWNNRLSAFIWFTYSTDHDKADMLSMSVELHRQEGDGITSSEPPAYGDPYFNQLFHSYLLPQVLSQVGRPSQVSVRTRLDEPDRPPQVQPQFVLRLVYEDQGVLVEYILPKESTGKKSIGCPLKPAYLTVEVVPPEQGASLTIREDPKHPIFLEHTTSMTLDDFYQTFKDPQNVRCIEILPRP